MVSTSNGAWRTGSICSHHLLPPRSHLSSHSLSSVCFSHAGSVSGPCSHAASSPQALCTCRSLWDSTSSPSRKIHPGGIELRVLEGLSWRASESLPSLLPHCTSSETKAQRGEGTGPISHSKSMVEPQLEPRPLQLVQGSLHCPSQFTNSLI